MCGWLDLVLGRFEVVFGFGYFEFGFANGCGLLVVCIGCLILLSVWLLVVDFGFGRFGWWIDIGLFWWCIGLLGLLLVGGLVFVSTGLWFAAWVGCLLMFLGGLNWLAGWFIAGIRRCLLVWVSVCLLIACFGLV